MINYNITEKKILKYIIENGKCFQNDIQKDLELDKSNLSRFLHKSLEDKILIKIKEHNKNIFYFNADRYYTLIFEWNRHNIDCFLSNLYGDKIESLGIKQLDFKDIGSLFKIIYDSINRYINEFKIGKIVCVCFVIHGMVIDQTTVKYIPSCNWKDINLKTILENIIDADILVENYTNLGAFYEKLLYYSEYSSLALVKLKTGIGGGLIVDNKIYNGHNGATLEIGHLKLTPDSDIKYVDLLENYFINENLNSYGFSSSIEFIKSYNAGDKNAVKLYKIFLKNWIFALKNLNAIINPSVLLLYNDILNKIPHCIFEIKTSFNDLIVSPEIIDFSKIKLDDYYRGINFLYLNKKFNLNIEKIGLLN